MAVPACSSFSRLHSEGRHASYVRSLKSHSGILDIIEVERPAGDMSRPAVPDVVLFQDLLGGGHVAGDLGGGRFSVNTRKGDLTLAAPDFAAEVMNDSHHQLRSFVFPVGQWQDVLDHAASGQFSLDSLCLYGQIFDSPAIRSALRNLWTLCENEGAPSRLLARAAGCEIMAELCRLSGAPFAPAKGGLAPWAERRCLDMMRAHLSEDISLDELAAEARLSSFHFARMFKQSVGMPPRVYLTKLRMEKACELLEHTDLSITQIAQEVGYSSNQVLARIFLRHMHASPSDYRRAVRDPVRQIRLHAPGTALSVPSANQ